MLSLLLQRLSTVVLARSRHLRQQHAAKLLKCFSSIHGLQVHRQGKQ
jgi:hypothetical protein